MRWTVRMLIKDQKTKVPPVVTTDLTGKTVVVIGANTGIGFEATKHFARMNPRKLILACRNKEKGEAALAEINRETGCKTAELRLVDLSDFNSVRSFARTFEEKHDRLDILLESAAVSPVSTKPEFTKNGWELGFQVNDLSPAYLALLLVPRMLDTAKRYNTIPRITLVTSELHYWTEFKTEWLESPDALRKFGHKDMLKEKLKMDRYPQTKLIDLFFARALSDRLPKGSNVIVNCATPGYCYSALDRNIAGFQKVIIAGLRKALARSTEEGSRQFVWAAVGPAPGEKYRVEELQGAYISLHSVREPSDYVISDQGRWAQNKLFASFHIKDLRVHGEN
ncbi:hypothetical protein D9613_012358 [Agrocybe pediades]|uniref:Uncharacterized protein n=1 Tax=Agrocybe pediades TaxID=84607 RepID=A0A8H4QRX8_9AGAR|nr:hypothetical protein D9613_012358 [Agrocybe pediades]